MSRLWRIAMLLGMLLGAASGRSYFIHLKNVVSQFRLTEL